MTDEQKTESGAARLAVNRRRLLAGLGAAGAAAVAGCSDGDDEPENETGETNETDGPNATESPAEDGPSGEHGDGIDPRFGYTSTEDGEEPPVEPDHTVELLTRPVEGRPIPEFYFEPTGLAVEPGDTVEFQLATAHHNVNAYHNAIGYNQRVPNGVAPFSSPILTAGDEWLYTFEQEGVHDFMCAPHETFGMVGRIVAGKATGPGANPVGEAPGGDRARAPEFTAALVLDDDALAPDTIVTQESVSWDDIAEENKQLTLAPTEAAPERDQ
jgi:plastocyanin